MRGLSNPWALIAVGAMCATACGLRSDPESSLFCSADSSEDTGGEARSGSCSNPIPLPAGNLVVRGNLGGCSEASGWCGADAGPEDVYELVPPAAMDITLTLREDETTFPATLRVSQGMDPCVSDATDTELCAPDAVGRTSWSFRADEAQTPIYVAVDSAGFSSSMEYAFDVQYGGQFVDPGCPLFPEVIVLGTGGVYIWEDTLARDQGYIDGACDMPGAEHIFEMTLKSAGVLTVTVEPLDSELQPAVSVRTSCAANKEQGCAGASGPGAVVVFDEFMEPGKRLLAVDQIGVSGGAYRMTATLN